MAQSLNQNSKAIIIGLTDTGEMIPAAAGRISTQSGTAQEILLRSQDSEKNANLISKVTRSGHNSTIEHTVYNIAFQNVSVAVEQFVIEFRLASYTVKSRRYVDFTSMGYYTPVFSSASITQQYQRHMEYLYSEYEYFLQEGIEKEDARFLLPYSLYSNFYCTINARELIHMLHAMIYGRGKAFPELFELGLSLLRQAKAKTPGIFIDFEIRRPKKADVLQFDYDEIDLEFNNEKKPVELLSFSSEPEKSAARAALIEYTNLSSKAIEKIVSNEAECEKIIKNLLSISRPRALESVNFTFRLNGVSLACVTHFARHRIQSAGFPSLLLTDRGKYIIPPCVKENKKLLERYNAAFSKTKELYMKLQKQGVKEELLVYLQLSGNTLDFVTTMNARQLLLFLRLRTCNRAQWEIRDFAIDMLKILRKQAPAIFNAYGPGCYLGKCPEGPMTCGKAAQVIEYFKPYS
ncbi:MAG TPA: FAD-dependent thymidylate synthase [Oscillospiraceae bacterium]|nr:FAD-dependent thymidylate synthase [Oscillospiraceae bacterium]